MIRKATPEDAPAIARLHVRTWQATYRGQMPDAYLDALDPAARLPLWTRVLADPASRVSVAEVDGAVMGFCSLVVSRDDDAGPGVGEIAAIYVDASRWRAGVGRALLDAAIADARAHGMRELTLWVLRGNEGARAFYEAHGFRTDGAAKVEERTGFPIHEVRYRRSVSETAPP